MRIGQRARLLRIAEFDAFPVTIFREFQVPRPRQLDAPVVVIPIDTDSSNPLLLPQIDFNPLRLSTLRPACPPRDGAIARAVWHVGHADGLHGVALEGVATLWQR